MRFATIIALLISAGLFCTGRYAEQKSKRDWLEACLPTEGLVFQDWKLVPTDPAMRAKQESAAVYRQVGELAYILAVVIPVMTLCYVTRRRK